MHMKKLAMVFETDINVDSNETTNSMGCRSLTIECAYINLANKNQKCPFCALYVLEYMRDLPYLEYENEEIKGFDQDLAKLYGTYDVGTYGLPSNLSSGSAPSNVSSPVKLPLRLQKLKDTERNEWCNKLEKLKQKITRKRKLLELENDSTSSVGSGQSCTPLSTGSSQHLENRTDQTPTVSSDRSDDSDSNSKYPWLGDGSRLRSTIEIHLQKARVINNISNMEATLEKTQMELEKLTLGIDISGCKRNIQEQLRNLACMKKDLDVAEAFKATVHSHQRLMKELGTKVDICDPIWKKHKEETDRFIEKLESVATYECPVVNGAIPVLKDLVQKRIP